MKQGRRYFTNTFIEEGDITKILLPDNTFAIIDTNQLKFVKDYSWYYYKNKYSDFGVIALKGRQQIRLHHLIAPFGKVCHINGDKRDCRKLNMGKYDHPQLRKNHGNNKGKAKLLGIRKRINRFEIVKRFTEDRKGKMVKFCFFFQKSGKNPCKYKNRDEAWQAAVEKLKEVSKWTRDDVKAEYDKRKAERVNIGEVILDWSIWEDRGPMSEKEKMELFS